MRISVITNVVLVLLLAACSNPKNQTNSIKFIVTVDHINENDTVFITGSLPEIGNWNPHLTPMKKVKNNQWEFTLNTNAKTHLEYKFTLGSYEREGAIPDGSALPNFNAEIGKGDTIITHLIEHWTVPGKQKTFGQITGHVEYFTQMEGEGILPRDVIIWLPKEYETEPNRKFPVLYMHDGQNIIDPATSSFGIDWQIDETMDSLISNGLIEPTIVVGAYCTANRREEYGDGEQGKAYRKWLVEVLKPRVDETYRTKTDKQNTTIAGSSMGGICSMAAIWDYPEVYKGGLCFSPAFKFKHFNYVAEIAGYTGPKKDILIYIDNGGIGLENELQPGVDDMLVELKKQGYTDQELLYIKDENAKHFESDWAKRFPKAILWLNQ